MSTFPANRPRRKLPIVVALLAILVAVLAVAGYVLWPRFESEPPQITVAPSADVLGVAPLEIRITDKGTGLKSVTATLSQGGTEHNLVAEPLAGPQGEKMIAVALAKLAGIKEGPAVLRVTALEVVADDRYVNFGGVGVIVYRTSADAATSGVKIGDYFFPGFPGQIKDRPDHWLVLFAHPYDALPETRPVLAATDQAGNTRELRLAYELKDFRYRKSTLPISEGFVQNKVAPLVADASSRQGALRDVFVAVNKRLRKENEDRITAITRQATPTMLWEGAFAQLSNSKVEANFADQRTYTYNGEVIDTAYHLGYDLSVTKNYPVEAANSGKVAFTGDLGIYGNTVILDHGLGLFTLYSHLSAIDVQKGDAVTRRQILGKTGETGLAAGDHLHYGVYLSGVAVLPVEWWDAKWIDDNITPKLQGRSGQEIAEAQQAVKGKAKVAAKRRR
jgi:murein DD-endopeptidase MepM/ murein hydrolase activator NlpD